MARLYADPVWRPTSRRVVTRSDRNLCIRWRRHEQLGPRSNVAPWGAPTTRSWSARASAAASPRADWPRRAARVCVLERGRRFAARGLHRPPRAARRPALARARQPRRHVRRAPDARRHRHHRGRGRRRLARLRQRPAARAGRRVRLPAGRPRSTARALDPWYDRTEDALQPRTTPADPALRQGRAPSPPRARHAGARGGPAADRGPLRRAPRAPVQRRRAGGLPEPRRAATSAARSPPRTPSTSPTSRAPSSTARGPAAAPRHRPRAARARRRALARRLQRTSAPARTAPSRRRSSCWRPGRSASPRLLLHNRRRLPGLSPALGTRFSGNGDALGIAFDPQAPDVRGARNDYRAGDDERARPHRRAPPDRRRRRPARRTSTCSSTSRAASTSSAAGGAGCCACAHLLVLLGLTDQALRPRDVALAERRSDTDSLDLPDDRPRRRRRADAPDAAAAALRHPLEQGGQRAAVRRPRAHRHELAEGAQATPFYALEGGPLSTFTTVHPLGGCPMADDPARRRGRRRRPRARLPGPARARRLDRPDRTANAFSLPNFALSTANLYAATQNGGTLFGLQLSNPVDTTAAYAGPTSSYGQADDPLVGKQVGGINVFGGGLGSL